MLTSVGQSRPVGMAGARQFPVLTFSDFVSALVGITNTRASVFACLPTSGQRAMALGIWMRNAASDWADSREVTHARDKETMSVN